MPRQKRKPTYTLHKPTGQARVRIDGRDHYLGQFGSDESRQGYDDLVAEWLTRQDVGRLMITVEDLALLYLEFARGYYQLDGQPSREFRNIQSALRLLVAFSGTMRVRMFAPRQFARFRDWLVGQKDARGQSDTARPLTRQYINKLMLYVVRCFKWGVAEEYVPEATWSALRTVPGLKKGRTVAPESRKVLPVDDALVDAVVKVLSPTVAAMVELQRATGMRSRGSRPDAAVRRHASHRRRLVLPAEDVQDEPP